MSHSTNSNFKQARLTSHTLNVTPFCLSISFAVLGIIFVIVGALCYYVSNSIAMTYYRYDDECQNQPVCTINVPISAKMTAPLYFYYQLDNFFQNVRGYVKSQDEKQLTGSEYSLSGKNCDPLAQYKNYADRPDTLLDEKILYPCGLPANSFFRDTFNACIASSAGSVECDQLTGDNWKKEGIAWTSDLNKKFASRAPLDEETNISPFGFVLPLPADEDFVVWMRTATLSSFTKFHRQILSHDIEKDQILRLTINNAFNVSGFGGKKGIIITETSALGGKDNFLGLAFIIVGLLAFVNSLFIRWKGKKYD